MNGQAFGLQSLSRGVPAPITLPRIGTPLLVVTGGKGGIGKTTLTANLAYALSAMGTRVLAVDLDLGLANLDVFLRLLPRHHLGAVASGEKSAGECILEGPGGMSVIPGPSGVEEMAALSSENRRRVWQSLGTASRGYDLVIADSAAGIAPDGLAFAASADRTLIVTTPEPAALTDAYSMMKILLQRQPSLKLGLVVNNAANMEEAATAARKLHAVAQRFLGKAPEDLGWIPRDATIPRANREQRLFVAAYPESLAAASLRQLARRLREWIR